jgi:hypothetical protein
METTPDKFTILAERICIRCFGGSLPDAPEEIVSALLTHVLADVPEFQRASDEIAKRALEGFAVHLCDALRAHVTIHNAGWLA